MVSTRVQKRNGGAALRAAGSPSRSTVLVDSSRRWLETIGEIVRSFGMEVAGAATTPEAALRLVEEHQPDLLVSEIGLDGENDGIAFLRAAQARAPELAVVVLSASDDVRHIAEAFAAGARVYLVKTDHPYDLASAMREAFERSITADTHPKESAAVSGKRAES